MRYTITAVTAHQEGIENIRGSLLRHGIDMRAVSLTGRRAQGWGPLHGEGILVSVATDDAAEVEVIKAALAAGEGSDIRVSEAVGAQAEGH